MQNSSQKRSKEQQSSKSKAFNLFSSQMEFSKKMAIFDTIYYIVFIIASITLAIVWPAFAAICPDLVTIFTTGLITLRLGYTAKAGVENYKKIERSMRDCNSYEYEYEKEEEELG